MSTVPVNSGEKWCTACKRPHPLAAFGADRRHSDGLASRCRLSRRVGPRPRRPQPKGASHPKWTGRTRQRPDGYVLVHCLGHPRADSNGDVLEHVLVVEKAIERELPGKAQVHHVNAIKSDNSRGNLVVCEDKAYHFLLHIRQRALDACGHASWRKCPYCQRYDDTVNMIVHSTGKVTPQYCHRDCRIARRVA